MKHIYNTNNNTALIEVTKEELSDLLLIVNTAEVYDTEKGIAGLAEQDSKYWLSLYKVRLALIANSNK